MSSGAAAILGRVMLGFEGDRLPTWVEARLANAPAAGVTLFRHHNVRNPSQVRELVEAIQAAACAGPFGDAALPLLIAADQEGGQLQALGDGPTQFPGNMALGAIGDSDLAERVGAAIGSEVRAMGVNMLYAPVLDVASNPRNVALGIRSFGDDPAAVARLGSAFIRGVQQSGVAATVKHFPGTGDVSADTHHVLATIGASLERLRDVELPPFRAGIEAGARLVMSSHAAVPGLTGDPGLPGTLADAVMTDLLRGELGFDGVTISDALDMAALAQGEKQRAQMVMAANAGVDLFLCAADREKLVRIEAALSAGARDGAIDADRDQAARRRIAALRRWLADQRAAPDPEVVGGAPHQALALEVAARALTLAGDPSGLLPLRLDGDARLVAIMPIPTDLTPADTSSTVTPGLAAALNDHHPRVEEVVVSADPSVDEIAGVCAQAGGADIVIIGTIDAFRSPGQTALVRAVAGLGRPTVAVAMRTPWDLEVIPPSVTAVCTYSILAPSMTALAAALFGHADWAGALPVTAVRDRGAGGRA